MRVELYHFYTRPTLQEWRYASSRTNVTANSETWTATAIKRSKFDQENGTVRIDISRDEEPGILFRQNAPPASLYVSIYKSDGTTLIYSGYIRRVIAKGHKGTWELECGPATESTWPTRTFGRTCWKEWGSTECGVSVGSFTVNVGAGAVSGTSITHPNIDAKADGYFIGGIVENGNESRYILDHVGDTATIDRAFEVNTTGTFTLKPGCNKTRTQCTDKFSNVANFGGFDKIPTNNPVRDDFS